MYFYYSYSLCLVDEKQQNIAECSLYQVILKLFLFIIYVCVLMSHSSGEVNETLRVQSTLVDFIVMK